jgi:enoyl-CoA hydratase/carnithine racemase
VCGVNGVALGGGAELALLTDVLVCSEEARFGLPELKLGLIPGIGGTQRFPRAVGKANAMRYILTSDLLPAQRAYEMGIVSDIFKKEELHQKTLHLATQISEKPLKALIAAKSAIKQSAELSLSQGVRYERTIFYPLYDSKGTKEGIAAFVEKRAPKF